MQIVHLPVSSLAFKSSILGGLMSISAITGIFTLIEHKNTIFSVLTNRTNEVKSFLENSFNPLFNTVNLGFKSIFDKYLEWIKYVESNNGTISNFLQLSNMKKGYENIDKNLSDWSSSIYRLASGIYDKVGLSDEDQIRDFISKLSNAPYFLKNIFYVSMAFAQDYFVKKDNSKLEVPKDLSKFLSSSWSIFRDNSDVVKDLDNNDYMVLTKFMSEKSGEFVKKIDQISKNGKWGKYKNRQEMIEDILPEDYQKMVLFGRISSVFRECGSGTNTESSCWNGKITIEELKKFKDISSKSVSTKKKEK